MAKYIIDIPEKAMMYLNVWEYKDGKCVWADSYTPSNLRPYVASESYIDGLKEGRNDAWEFAKTVSIMKPEDKRECWGTDKYNTINLGYSYQEAKDRYEEWRKEKDQIRVGDEVIPLDTQYNTMVVTKLWTSEFRDEWVDTIADDGKTYNFLKTSIKKTGRHFPEVAELLKKMRGEEE